MSTSVGPDCSKEEIVAMAKKLCDDYVEDRLIRSGLQLKERKLAKSVSEVAEGEEAGSTRSRPCRVSTMAVQNRSSSGPNSIGGITPVSLPSVSDCKERRAALWKLPIDRTNPDDISRVLIWIGVALETRYSATYVDVLAQLNINMLSELALKRAFYGVAKQLFSNGISWAKIVSLFAFSGGLSVDCVINGANMYVGRVKKWTVHYISEELCSWIQLNGGWVGVEITIVLFGYEGSQVVVKF